MQVLSLQLRRGHWDAAAGHHVKLRGPVAFPLHLDLKPFVGLAASSTDEVRDNHDSAAGGVRSQPRSSSSSMGSIFLRQLDQVFFSLISCTANTPLLKQQLFPYAGPGIVCVSHIIRSIKFPVVVLTPGQGRMLT